MYQKVFLLALAVLSVNLLSRFYGFWVISQGATRRKKGLLFWPAIFIQLLVPLPFPVEYTLLKFLLLSNTCLHVFKLIDYYHRYDFLPERDKNFKRFFHSFECMYTTNIRKSFVRESPIVSPRSVISKGLLYIVLGMACLLLNRHYGWWKVSPLMDYFTLGVEYYFLCVGLVYFGVGIHRGMGYRVNGFFREPIRARSPLEFWARWNIPVHEWLRDNIYKKLGGHRHRYRGLFATFFLSGLFHEYILSMASNTLNGYMLAYFMIQFLVLVSSMYLNIVLKNQLANYPRVRSARWFRGVSRLLTFTCILLPVPLFIHNFKKVFPIHNF